MRFVVENTTSETAYIITVRCAETANVLAIETPNAVMTKRSQWCGVDAQSTLLGIKQKVEVVIDCEHQFWMDVTPDITVCVPSPMADGMVTFGGETKTYAIDGSDVRVPSIVDSKRGARWGAESS